MKFDVDNYKQFNEERKNYKIVWFYHGNTLIGSCSANEDIIIRNFDDDELMVNFANNSYMMYCTSIELSKFFRK